MSLRTTTGGAAISTFITIIRHLNQKTLFYRKHFNTNLSKYISLFSYIPYIVPTRSVIPALLFVIPPPPSVIPTLLNVIPVTLFFHFHISLCHSHSFLCHSRAGGNPVFSFLSLFRIYAFVLNTND